MTITAKVFDRESCMLVIMGHRDSYDRSHLTLEKLQREVQSIMDNDIVHAETFLRMQQARESASALEKLAGA
jgi:hypothetical protein